MCTHALLIKGTTSQFAHLEKFSPKKFQACRLQSVSILSNTILVSVWCIIISLLFLVDYCWLAKKNWRSEIFFKDAVYSDVVPLHSDYTVDIYFSFDRIFDFSSTNVRCCTHRIASMNFSKLELRCSGCFLLMCITLKTWQVCVVILSRIFFSCRK